MIQAQIFSVLSQDSYVAAIVGSRIYPVRLPREAVLPAVVYQIPSIEPVYSMDGDSGIDDCSVQIACWAKDYTTAHTLAFSVRKALIESGLRIFTESQNDDEDLETHSYGIMMSFKIWSASNIGSSPVGALNPIFEFGYYPFVGDGVTTEFATPEKFRANTMVLFINGRVATKGVTGEYVEWDNCEGVTFTNPPAGGEYKDEILAYYAKA